MHVPDEMPAVGGPLDIAYAALVTAANADAAATAVEAPTLYADRQRHYRDGIRGMP
jgi:hypothetical protein